MCALTNSAAAIALFERPSAANEATRCSVSVSSAEAGLRPLMRRSSCARLLRPQPGAELLEGRECLLECLARCSFLLRLALHRAEREQGAGALERIGEPFVLVQRPVERCEGSLVIALRGGE